MKLIVLVNQNLNKTNLKRFDLNLNKQTKLKKKFWSILPLTNKKLFLEYEKSIYRPKKNKNFINLKNYFLLFKKIQQVKKNTLFLNLSGDFVNSIIIEFIMKLKGCIILKKIEWYNYVNQKKSILKRIGRLYKIGFFFMFKKIGKSAFQLLKNCFLRTFTFEPNFYIVENQEKATELEKKGIKNLIKVNSFTYSEFHKVRSYKKPQNYFVFLDSEIENSFESKILNNKHNSIIHDTYWKCLDEIFDKLSKKFKMNVKVAAHFRRGDNNCPINKDFYFDQTLNLIKNSNFVVVQNSSTIDWAILLKKPILLLNFEIFDRIALENSDSIEFYREKLFLEVVNIDLNYKYEINWGRMNKILKINKNKFKQFSEFHLNYKNNSFNHLNQWEMIYNYFKKNI